MEGLSKFVSRMGHFVRCLEDNDTNVEAAIKECSRKLKEMMTMMNKVHSTGVRQHIASCICLVQSFRTKMKLIRRTVGAGYKPLRPDRANYRSMRVKWEDSQSAFSNRIRTGVVINLTHKDPAAFLEDASELFRRRIIHALKKHTSLKVNAVFCGEFVLKKCDEDVIDFKYMNTKNIPIYGDTNLSTWFQDKIQNPIRVQLEEFQEKCSGWALSSIIHLAININKFTPQLGSSYIELSRAIKLEKACVNVKNDDDACFAWAVTSALHPATTHADRISSYPHYSYVLKMKNISMPMTTKQISRFEKQNDISINVYIVETNMKDCSILPTYLTKEKQAKHVNLLLIQDQYMDEVDGDDGQKPRYHYVWIKNLSRLASSQLSKAHGRKYFCDRCLRYYHSELQLSTYDENCKRFNECLPLTPKPGTNMSFKNYKNKTKVPFVIYGDLECILKPSTKQTFCATESLQEHIPYAVGYYVKCSYDDTLSFYKSYSGEDCMKWFASEMLKFAEEVETVFLCPLPIEITPKHELEFQLALNCHVCEKPLGNDRVRDHCHLTGQYRGPAHNDCNISFQDSHVIPVVFHNLSGYDSHFIIKNLAKDFEGRVDLLPINKERYISFSKHVDENLVKFRFIDSFRFLASSLNTLSSYLPDYPILYSQFSNLEEFKLLTRKGVFPYDYIDSWDKLNMSLPQKHDFYSKLADSQISDADYHHAFNVWIKFGCKNLGEYSQIYLKSDVLLLADVFEQFRQSCLKTYSLDPAHYYTLPGYTWDAMLKHTAINLELLSDLDMIMFVEKGIRGGLSQCSHRYAKANNKYMSDYNPNEPSKYLAYFDINNQYGWAMSQHLPYGGFEWIDTDNFDFNIPLDSPFGYILEVDLDYPESEHDYHRDLPFLPEHRETKNSKEKKLLATLYYKERYVIHYRNLIQALEHGLVLKKIHRVLKFEQSDWLKSYIDLNTKLRTAANNDFEKDLFKLMNNAVFGKTTENIRKHSIVKLVTKWGGRYGAEALISKPQFKSVTIFDENLVAIELNKTAVYFNKPIYVGMCILDILKLKIYDFHYKYLKNRFGNKARVCYTDTDSLIYEVECDDLYDSIKPDIAKYFDTSSYDENNIYNIPRLNKKVLGMMKDENSGKIMVLFVGLRSKMYAIQLENKHTTKKIKGIKKHIVQNRITIDDYIKCLTDGVEKQVKQTLFRTRNHNVSTVEQSKVALNACDDKRYICSDGVSTLPWGHYSIMKDH